MKASSFVSVIRLSCACLFFFVFSAFAAPTEEPAQPSFFQHVSHRLSQIWYEGTLDLYVTGYAWHNRFTYRPEKIATYNELAYGGGIGKGFVDEDGDWHALYAMGFSDSHANFQPLAGYGFQKRWYFSKAPHLGAGFTWFATMRKDIFHGIPFIGFPLPMVSIGAGGLDLFATYVPGGKGNGNVLFMFGKWTFT